MKEESGVEDTWGEEESEQGLHFTSCPIGSPCHTNTNDSAPGPPFIKTQPIYTNSHKQELSKLLIYGRAKTVIDWNAIPLHIKEIEERDKFKAAIAQHYMSSFIFTEFW